MRNLAAGARQLPSHHLTIRVPWHDAGWSGTLSTATAASGTLEVWRKPKAKLL